MPRITRRLDCARALASVRDPMPSPEDVRITRQLVEAGRILEINILYLHGRTGMYLEPAGAEAGVTNVLKMAREGLRRYHSSFEHARATQRLPPPESGSTGHRRGRRRPALNQLIGRSFCVPAGPLIMTCTRREHSLCSVQLIERRHHGA